MSSQQLISPDVQIDIEALLRLRTRLLPPFKVIIFNDDEITMDHVVFTLLHVVNSLSVQEAERIMLTAHLTGSAVVIVCPKETAEHYQERLRSYGLPTKIEPD